MNLDYTIALTGAGIAAAVAAFLFVKWALKVGKSAGERSGGGGSVRSLLVLPAAFFQSRRMKDRELDKAMTEYEKLVVQSGGVFLEGASAAEIFAAKFVFPLTAAVFFVLLGAMLQLPPALTLLATAAFGIMLYLYPDQGLREAARVRTTRFSRDLPETLDVMQLVAQSGGDLLSAIRSAVEVSPKGPVRDELVRALGEVAIGASLAASLNHIAARIDTPEANAVFTTLSQSLEMGTSVVENLGGAAALIRRGQRIKAQEKAQKAVVAMSFPLLLLILPGVFIVLFAPMIIQYALK